MSSGVHLSNMIGFLVDGMNISSSRFAMEQRGTTSSLNPFSFREGRFFKFSSPLGEELEVR